jgi:hypothetical protein
MPRNLIVARDGDLSVERDPERPSGRLLRQDNMDGSYVDLADPRHLEFDYLRWAGLVLRAFAPRHVVHVGGGAATLARALLADDHRSRQEVNEIDERVLGIARAHLGLRRQPGLRLRVGDGRELLARSRRNSADAIVIDAFRGARVPRHLVTREAFAVCARVAPLTLVNVVDTAGWPLARAIAAGLGEAYPSVAGLASGSRRGGNVILFGSMSPPDLRRLEGAAASDRHPARLLRAADLAGTPAWRDEELAPDG